MAQATPTTDTPPLECFRHAEGSCEGPVEPRMYDNGQRYKNVTSCAKHFEKLLEAIDRDRELQSDVAPDWFDEANAGERWDDDY
jgi:hypothetical protein